MAGLKVILGGSIFWFKDQWNPEKLQAFLDCLAAADVKGIDTAQIYGESEAVLGEAGSRKNFEIGTKLPGTTVPGSFKTEKVVERTQESLRKLKVHQVDILYLHIPDPSTPIEETLQGIQKLFTAGAFRRFGLSNYSVDDVRKIYEHQKSKGWVLPSVYQGCYNPISRHYEEDLLPLLRKLEISFYAYSPTAGGFLAKSKQQVLDGVGRFGKDGGVEGVFYNELYNKPALLDILTTWSEIARDAGTSPYHLATRWVSYHSALKPEYGDALIIGVHGLEQLNENLAGLEEGPLSPDISERADAVWERARHETTVIDADFIMNMMRKINPT
ncbi:putative aldehyde reductase [Diaporthe ampelina]|uniref:Putative aldehyde reductase n=1 Tax=Diaporthe ampelina TaxID=1214573 RepID=A0A0G2FC15_9PEZI|nr:putative aldehyde reductase [Diaporthe ampelina]